MSQQRQAFLTAELAKQIKWFDEESTKHKQLHRKLRYTVFGLTTLSSALAGLALAFPSLQVHINVAILLATAAVGAVTSIEGLRKPSELWIHERTTFYSLKDLERDLQYHSDGERDATAADEIYDRMQSALGSARERWSRQIAGRSPTDSSRDQAALKQGS